MNMEIMNNNVKCKKCGYEWVPRVDDPVECPDCKSRNWRGEESKWDDLKDRAKGGD